MTYPASSMAATFDDRVQESEAVFEDKLMSSGREYICAGADLKVAIGKDADAELPHFGVVLADVEAQRVTAQINGQILCLAQFRCIFRANRVGGLTCITWQTKCGPRNGSGISVGLMPQSEGEYPQGPIWHTACAHTVPDRLARMASQNTRSLRASRSSESGRAHRPNQRFIVPPK